MAADRSEQQCHERPEPALGHCFRRCLRGLAPLLLGGNPRLLILRFQLLQLSFFS